MYEVAVGAYGEYFDTHFLQLFIFAGEILKFRRADEGEIGRIEEENGPFAFQVVAGYGYELVVVVCLNFEFGQLCIDYCAAAGT